MAWGSGIAGRCEVAEDGYEEQIIIPKEQRDLAAEEGIGTGNKQKVAVQILKLNTGESYTGRLAITGNHQVYLPTEIQKTCLRLPVPTRQTGATHRQVCI